MRDQTRAEVDHFTPPAFQTALCHYLTAVIALKLKVADPPPVETH